MVFQFWKVRRRVDVDDLLDIGGLVDRREQPAALEIVGDDLGDADADLGIAGRARRRNSGSRSAAARSCPRERSMRFGAWAKALRERDRASSAEREPFRKSSAGGSGGTASRAIHLCQSLLSDFVPYRRSPAGRARSGLSLGEHGREVLPFFEIGRRQIIRLALDDRAQRALLIDAQDTASPACRPAPACLPACRRASSWMLKAASGLLRFDAAIGLLPAALDLRLNIEPQVAELSAALPLARPSAALEFSVSPVTACRVGSRLSSSAAIFD